MIITHGLLSITKVDPDKGMAGFPLIVVAVRVDQGEIGELRSSSGADFVAFPYAQINSGNV